MHRTVLLVVALSAALAALVRGCGGQREAIARAEARASHLRLQRDSLAALAEAGDRARAALLRERGVSEARLTELRGTVARLERERTEGRRAVRGIRTTGALQARLRAAYPALGDGGWGLTTLPLDGGDTLGLEYLLVPAWFAETFLVDRANARSWRAQRDRLVAVDSLRGAVATLQDSLAALAEARAEAWSIGYDSAYTRHQELTRRYVAALDRPRIRLPGILGLAAAAGVGLMVGRVMP